MATLQVSDVRPVLRIQVSTLVPFQTVIWGPNGTFTCVGVGPNLYDWIAKRLNFKYVLVPVADKAIRETGQYNASRNLLIAGDADMMTTPNLEMSLIHLNYMEVTHPYLYQETKLLLPVPEEDTFAWQIIAPFSPMVWLGFVFVLFTIPVFMSIFFRMISKMADNRGELDHEVSFASNFLYVFAIFTNHELGNNWINRKTVRRNSLFILIGIWLLAMTVAVNVYAGVFASFITVPKMKPTIDTLEDLAADRDLLIGSRYQTVMLDRMMTAESGVYKALGDRLRANSSGLFHSEDQRSRLIASKKYAIMLVETVVYYAIASDFKRTKYCHYTASPPLPYSTYLSFGLVKNGRHNQDINKAFVTLKPFTNWIYMYLTKWFNYFFMKLKSIMALWETGLLKKWSADAIPRYQQCLIKKNPAAVRRPIKLTDLASAFYVFLIGIGASAFVFSIELVSTLKTKPVPI